MTPIYVLENKISSVEKYLSRLHDFQEKDEKDFEKDQILQSALERNLYLVCQATIELSEASVKHLGLRKPRNYKEGFEILMENKIIDQKLTESMRKLARFRNILTHAYEKIETNGLIYILKNNLQDIEKFKESIRDKVLK